MLTAIREKTQGIIAAILMTLVAVPFVLWGTHSYFDSGQDINVAKVNGDGIRINAFRQALEQAGTKGSAAANLNSQDLKMRVLDDLINRKLLADDAEEQGYRVDNATLNRLVRQLPYFQRQGSFDPQLYETLLSRERLTPAEFELRMRSVNVIEQVAIGYTESAFVTSADLSRVAAMMTQKRQADYVRIGPDRFIKQITLGEEEIGRFYSDNSEQFKNPELVRIEYIRLDMEDLAKEYQPTEKELRAAYESEQARYTTPAKRRASHILLDLPAGASTEEVKAVKAKLGDLERQLRSGGDFASLAKKYSQDPLTAKQGGDLGEISPGVLPPEVELALFALSSGQIGKPVRSSYGYHVIKLTGYTPEVRQPYAKVRGELAKQLRKRRSEERFYEYLERLGNLAYEYPDSLEPAAKDLGLRIEQSGWFSKAGGKGVAAHRAVVDATFSEDVIVAGRNSDPVEIAAGSAAVLRIGGHRQATLKPLAQVRDDIERILKQRAAEARASQLGAELVTQLRAGRSLHEIAKAHGLTVQTTAPFTRDRAPKMDPQLVQAIFSARKPQAGKHEYAGVDLGAGGYVVFGLKSVEEGSLQQLDAAQKEEIRRMLLRQRGQAYHFNYLAGLKDKAEIRIFKDKL